MLSIPTCPEKRPQTEIITDLSQWLLLVYMVEMMASVVGDVRVIQTWACFPSVLCQPLSSDRDP